MLGNLYKDNLYPISKEKTGQLYCGGWTEQSVILKVVILHGMKFLEHQQ